MGKLFFLGAMLCVILKSAMQFQTPQFLDVEDKLFGFLTFKQFLYIAGGAGGVYIAYVYLPLFFFLIITLVVVPLSIALAFFKLNNKPFVYFVQAFLKYITSARLYIWRKVPKKIEHKKEEENKRTDLTVVPRLSESKLKELAWTLDIKSHGEGGGNTPPPF